MPNNQIVGTHFNNDPQAPHYFNGRLLTAEDLQKDQQAVLAHQSWLGQASGYGIIEGLMVTQVGPTSVKITAGIGLNRVGHLIRLESDVTVPLSPQATGEIKPIIDAGRFAPCDFKSSGSISSAPSGAYLLTAIPASSFKDQVPMKAAAGSVSSTDSSSDVPGCGSKWEIEGVQFKVILLDDFDSNGQGVSPQNRQNLLAHWCFGSPVLPDLALDPFHFPSNYNGLDLVDPTNLTPCDLPLAVFHWTGAQLTFVDAWSARRRLIRPDALVETKESAQRLNVGNLPVDTLGLSSPLRGGYLVRSWKGMLSDKRVAEGQARFLQFQDQVQKLIENHTAKSIVAAEYFRFLPPVGYLPIKLDFLLHLAGLPPLTKRIPVEVWQTSIQRAQAFIIRSQVAKIKEKPVAVVSAIAAKAENKFVTYLKSLLEQRSAQSLEWQRHGRDNLVNWGSEGFDPPTFFQGFTGMSINAALVDGETVDFTLRQSWYDEALDLTSVLEQLYKTKEEAKPGLGFPVLKLYFITENLLSPYDQPYLMFVKAMRPVVWYYPQVRK